MKPNRFKAGLVKPILVAATPEEHQKIRIAAAAAGMPMSHFLLLQGLTEAKKYLEKTEKKI